MRRFVADCSLTLAWCLADEDDAYAEATLDSLEWAEAVVPSLWEMETCNALLVAERRARLDQAGVTQALGLLAGLPIRVDETTHLRARSQTLPLARLHQLTAYDAAYLELALREDLPLASLDQPLNAAARAAGVASYKP